MRVDPGTLSLPGGRRQGPHRHGSLLNHSDVEVSRVVARLFRAVLDWPLDYGAALKLLASGVI
jgi:hypothetical protein